MCAFSAVFVCVRSYLCSLSFKQRRLPTKGKRLASQNPPDSTSSAYGAILVSKFGWGVVIHFGGVFFLEAVIRLGGVFSFWGAVFNFWGVFFLEAVIHLGVYFHFGGVFF